MRDPELPNGFQDDDFDMREGTDYVRDVSFPAGR